MAILDYDQQPKESHRLPAWGANLLLLGILAALWPLGLLLSANLDDYFYSVLLQIGLNVILATSLNLINGITGQFSLGHAAFMCLGAYTTGVLFKHYLQDVPPEQWNHGLTATIHALHLGPAAVQAVLGLGLVLLGGLVAGFFGLLIGIPTLRLRGDYLAIATLGFGEIIYTVISRTDQLGPFEVGGSSGLHNIPSFTNFFWAFGFTLVCVVAIWRIVHSGKGRAFLAVREDEIAAAAMGVDVTFYKVAAFTIGAFFAGVAGGMYGTLLKNVDPNSYRFMRSIDFVVMVVLGGSGSITGVLLAAVLLTVLAEGLRFANLEQYRLIIYSVLLIGMMLTRPEGLLGRREIWWTRRRPRPSDPSSQPDAPRPAA